MKHGWIFISLFTLVSLFGACDRGGDPVVDHVDPVDTTKVTPPPPPRKDTLIGSYTGICSTEDVFFDFQTGQFTTLRDTFPHEMKITHVDSFSATAFTIYTEELFFDAFFRQKGNFLDDTMFVQNYQSVHTERLAIIPSAQVVIRNKTTATQTGPGGSYLYCTYMKVE